MTLEEIITEANKLSIEDLHELSGFCEDLATCLEEEAEKSDDG